MNFFDFIKVLLGKQSAEKLMETYKQEHRHKCECGFIWQHSMANMGDFKKAHECPECGLPNTLKYRGKDKALCINRGYGIERIV